MSCPAFSDAHTAVADGGRIMHGDGTWLVCSQDLEPIPALQPSPSHSRSPAASGVSQAQPPPLVPAQPAPTATDVRVARSAHVTILAALAGVYVRMAPREQLQAKLKLLESSVLSVMLEEVRRSNGRFFITLSQGGQHCNLHAWIYGILAEFGLICAYALAQHSSCIFSGTCNVTCTARVLTS